MRNNNTKQLLVTVAVTILVIEFLVPKTIQQLVRKVSSQSNRSQLIGY